MADAETVLRQLLDRVIEEPYSNGNVTIEALNSGGANYTSVLYSATITKNNERPLKLFAKIANINTKIRGVMPVKTMFETEQYAYTELAKIFENIQDKYNLEPEHRFNFSKFYGGDSTDGQETVVLEDLVDQGYTPYSRFDSIDWEHATCAVDSIAKFHALSFAFAKEYPEKYAKVIEKMTYIPDSNLDNDVVKQTWVKMCETATQVVNEEHREKVRSFLIGCIGSDNLYKFRRPLSTPVLCHGDYRISNLLFKRQNGILTAMVLDYQTIYTGCPAVDLLYLEFMGTDVEFRRENHERLVEYYYSSLSQALQRLGVDVNEVYPRETFDSELKEMIPSALRTASFILPFVVVEAERAPQLGQATSVNDFAISPNKLFAVRFNGLVSDCIRWGAL